MSRISLVISPFPWRESFPHGERYKPFHPLNQKLIKSTPLKTGIFNHGVITDLMISGQVMESFRDESLWMIQPLEVQPQLERRYFFLADRDLCFIRWFNRNDYFTVEIRFYMHDSIYTENHLSIGPEELVGIQLF